jgi:PKD repeat protein
MRRLVAFASVVFTVVAVGCGGGDDPTAPSTPTQPTAIPQRLGPDLATASNGEGLSITTDKDDYQPGDTVWFTGAGWQPGDTLDIVLVDEPQTHDPHTWTILVGDGGTFLDSAYVVDVGDLGVTFTLTATSRSTGESLTVTFTDNIVAISVTLNNAAVPPALVVAPNAVVSLVINANVRSGSSPPNSWNSTGWVLQTSTTAPTGKLANCVDTDNQPGGGGGGTPTTRTFNITAPNTPGTYNLFLALSDVDGTGSTACGGGGGTERQGFNNVLTVAAPGNNPPTANAGGPYTTNEGSVLQLNGTGSDQENGTNVTYLWSIDVTGNTAPFVAIDAGGKCEFHATSDASDAGTTTSTLEDPYIKCNDDGVFKLTLVVTDQGSPPLSSTPATAQLTVNNVAPSEDAGGGTNGYTGNEGANVDLSGSFTDPGENDTHAYQWSYATVSGTDVGAACAFTPVPPASLTPKIKCNDDGTFKVTLIVLDDDEVQGSATGDDAALTLANVAPSITSLSVTPALIAVNNSVSLSASFTDDGTNDTHTAAIDWDDGVNADLGTISESMGSGSVSRSHTYTAAGIYTVKLTVTDDDTGSDTENFEYVVVYDPSAGFVTGGGWINSPPGAYISDPYLGGKATFGFVSKYLKGANTPTGNTEFQFHAAGMNFSSSSYEWLVVQGSNRATYKGVGTINGSGEYGFLLAAYDGGTSGDRFRIKIWVKSTKAVVYDNEIGTGDDATPTTLISGGSIVIHVPKK